MITVIVHMDGTIEFLTDTGEPPHLVLVDERGRWTNSPSVFAKMTDAEQAEVIAEYRNGGFEDRNP